MNSDQRNAALSHANAPTTGTRDIEKMEYITRVDNRPQIWQTISNFQNDDFIIENIVNHLDEGATQIHLSFMEDRFICSGNGKAVSPAGWERLTWFFGAGGEVPEKAHGLGVKNVGLRTGFTLGDDIWVLSSGRRTCLTLYKDGYDQAPFPAAWQRAMETPEAPEIGCRIEIPYRRKVLEVTEGERLCLEPCTREQIHDLFRDAVETLPRRLIGTTSPHHRPRFTLIIRHSHEGERRIEFEAREARGRGNQVLTARRARVFTQSGRLITDIRERGLQFKVPISDHGRIPPEFRRRGHVFGEVCWEIDGAGRPKAVSGRLRYPVAFPAERARTGLGLHLSGPFLGNRERRVLAGGGTQRDAEIFACAEDTIGRILRDELVPTFGPRAFTILLDPETGTSRRFNHVVRLAAQKGALPERRERRGSGTGNKRQLPRFRRIPPISGDVSQPVLPAFSWAPVEVSTALSTLVPRDRLQVHPGLPSEVLAVLGASVEPLVARFDESVVVERLCPEGSDEFPWNDDVEWLRSMTDPTTVLLRLNILALAIQRAPRGAELRDQIKEDLLLPDTMKHPVLWKDLWRSRMALPRVPGARCPSIVHSEVASHQAIQGGPLARPVLDLHGLLASLRPDAMSQTTRRAILEWLVKHEGDLEARTWKHLRALPIWETREGDFVTFAELCSPVPGLRRLLDGALHLPGRTTLSLKRVRSRGRGVFAVRKLPTSAEVMAWYRRQASGLPSGRPLNETERTSLDVLERNLDALRTNLPKPQLAAIFDHHVSLNQTGHLRRASELHLNSLATVRSQLRPSDLAASRHQELLANCGARSVPSRKALLATLTEIPADLATTAARLHALSIQLPRKSAEALRQAIDGIACLNIGDEILPPAAVAFDGQPDYWGTWLTKVPRGALAVGDQEILRRAGVRSARPRCEADSVAFFRWLTDQPSDVVHQHVWQIFRHWKNQYGPATWWRKHPNLRCLLTWSEAKGHHLTSRNQVFNRRPPILRPTERALSEAYRAAGGTMAEVTLDGTGSIQDILAQEAIPSITAAAGLPVRVRAEGTRENIASLAVLDALRAPRNQTEIPRRLIELEIDRKHIQNRFWSRLSKITGIAEANDLVAEYKIGRSRLEVPVDSGIDLETGTLLLLNRQNKTLERRLLRALAAVVLTPDAPGFATSTFIEIASSGRPENLAFQVPPRSKDGSEDNERESDSEDGTPEPRPGHPSPRPNHPVTPNPGPLPNVEESTDPCPDDHKKKIARRPPNHQEEVHKHLLKAEHYAYHCQA